MKDILKLDARYSKYCKIILNHYVIIRDAELPLLGSRRWVGFAVEKSSNYLNGNCQLSSCL